MEFRVLSFDTKTGSLLVNFFTDVYPDGLTYNVDVPVENGAYLSGEALRSHIMSFAPYGQIERLVALRDNPPALPDIAIDGNVPVVGQTTIPLRVSMRQARLALLQAGYLDEVETAMASMPREAQIEWEFATEVVRSSQLVSGMTAALGLTEQNLDDLFTLAASL